MDKNAIFTHPLRIVPSINIVFSEKKPVTYSLITEDHIILATDLHKTVAVHFMNLHNESLKKDGP